MPYVKIEPDIYWEHQDVWVYHLYEFDEPIKYWFTTNPDNADDFQGHGREGQFDVRMLVGRWESTPTVAQWNEWWKPRHLTEDHAMAALIEQAIDDGNLVACSALQER